MVANKILKRKNDERAYSSIHEMYHKVVQLKQIFMKRLVNQNEEIQIDNF